MGRSVHATFGWRLYKHIGGNVHLQECYKTYQIFLSLLKLDLFLGALLVILAYFYLLSDEVELITNIIALVVTAGWALLGWRAVSDLPLRCFALSYIHPQSRPSAGCVGIVTDGVDFHTVCLCRADLHWI